MSYTPIVLPEDLKTHIYGENAAEITRDDEEIITAAIDTAIQQTRMYLSRYDRIAMFGDPVAGTSATFAPDAMLLDIIKSIAVWQIIQLRNVGVDYETALNKYKMSIKSLETIQSGNGDPEWPYKDYTNVTTPASIEVTIHSNEKPNNYY